MSDQKTCLATYVDVNHLFCIAGQAVVSSDFGIVFWSHGNTYRHVEHKRLERLSFARTWVSTVKAHVVLELSTRGPGRLPWASCL